MAEAWTTVVGYDRPYSCYYSISGLKSIMSLMPLNDVFNRLKRLVLQLLPYHLRNPLFGLLRVALVPFESLYARFTSMRGEHIYRLTHNGQVCYLRASLNDNFKSPNGCFEIISVTREGEWLYAISEDGEMIPLAIDE